MTDNDDTPDPETPSPRSIAVTKTAAELGIELDEYDPVMEGVGVKMPPKPGDDGSDE